MATSKSSMSCLSGATAVSSKDLDRWACSLKNVLDSPRARKKFGTFLSKRRLDDAENTLRFWENCNRIVLDVMHDDHLRNCEKLNINVVSHARFHKQFVKLVEYAEENINFDVHQLRILRQTLAEDNVPKITKVIHQTLEALAELMRDEYNLFKKDMLKEMAVLKHAKEKKK